jgi:predicted DsbA family dithiol-disulfide isomerase
MPRLVAFSDYVCPFSYLAEPALARLPAEEGVEVEYRAFELRPAPAPLPDAGGEALAAQWRTTIEPLARALGVEARLPPVQPRSRKAHEAAKFARDRALFAEMHRALFHAFFVEGRDIGRIDVLVELGETVGLDRTELKVALDVDHLAERVSGD